MLKSFLSIIAVASIFCSCSTKSSNNSNQSDNMGNEMYMLVGTYTAKESKGIYVYKLDTVTGTSRYISEIKVDNPSYLVLDPTEKFVYAVSEDEDVETSAANAFSFDKKEGKLKFINKELTNGGAPCHINIDSKGKHVITANYLGGSMSIFETREDGGLAKLSQFIPFEGVGVDKERQTQPHIHFTRFSPDEKYLFADDLGTDKIHKFNVNTNDSFYLTNGIPDAIKIKDGSGPRHLVFHPNGIFAYLITELSGDVVAFDYKDGNLSEIQTIKADTLNAAGSADIHVSPDGRFLYASNRLKGDGIAIFSINQEDGILTKVAYQETGIHPRNFNITPNGKLLLVATRDSDLIQVFKIDKETGLLENTEHNIELSMPVCIQFASVK